MFSGKKGEKEIKGLSEINEHISKLEQKAEELSQEVEKLKKENIFCLQKLGLVRYSALQKIGGNQSFSLAILDKKNSGVVITSLSFKNTYRIFAKPIEQGKSSYSLSSEETEAVSRASILEKDKK